jgi:branched-subunit amino acid transport protein
MNEALLVFGMALVTFLIRYPMLAIVGRIELPAVLARALRFVPVAVLTAITIPAMLMPQGTIDLNLNNAYLYAGIISGLIAWRTKNLLLTIILGMAIFLLWRAVGG